MEFDAKLISFFFTIALISLRVGTLFMIFPFFSLTNIPTIAKISATLVLSVSLAPVVSPVLPAWSQDLSMSTYELLSFVTRELIIGISIGFIAKCFLYTALASAEWVGTQMGFTVSSMFDPSTQTNQSAWGSFHSVLALMLFVSIGGHYWCLQALVDSYSVNIGSLLSLNADNLKVAAFWMEIGNKFFFWMAKLSGPMIVVIMLLQMAMGVLSKFVPQINLWTVSIPATLGVGVFVFSLFSPMYGDVLGRLFTDGHEHMYMWMKVLKGGS